MGATPQTSLGDLEDEVMCPICGTLLELSESPQAERQQVYIARLIAAGKTKAADQGRPGDPVRTGGPGPAE